MILQVIVDKQLVKEVDVSDSTDLKDSIIRAIMKTTGWRSGTVLDNNFRFVLKNGSKLAGFETTSLHGGEVDGPAIDDIAEKLVEEIDK